MWADMFHMDVSVAEKILRPVIVYAFLVLLFRVAGKRELGQLNPLDLVVLLTISNTLQNAIIGNDVTITGGVVGASTLIATNALVVALVYARPRLRRLLEGDETILVSDGRPIHRNMMREHVSDEDLRLVLRRQGLERVSDVKRAILEPSGEISVVAKADVTDRIDAVALDRRLAAIEAMLRDLGPTVRPAADAP